MIMWKLNSKLWMEFCMPKWLPRMAEIGNRLEFQNKLSVCNHIDDVEHVWKVMIGKEALEVCKWPSHVFPHLDTKKVWTYVCMHACGVKDFQLRLTDPEHLWIN